MGRTIRLGVLQIFCVACALIHIGWFSATTASAAIGDLYVSDFSNGVVLKFSPTGTPSTFASGLTRFHGFAWPYMELSTSEGVARVGFRHVDTVGVRGSKPLPRTISPAFRSCEK